MFLQRVGFLGTEPPTLLERYEISVYYNGLDITKDPDGEWVRAEDALALEEQILRFTKEAT
jgi:hypothetical protein